MKESIYWITDQGCHWEHLSDLRQGKRRLVLSEDVKERVRHCRAYLEAEIEKEGEIYYGINTGFGSLCNVVISKERLKELQRNIIRSHAAGMGEEVPIHIARLILYLKIQNLAYGHSGVRLSLLERLVKMYNEDVIPVIYQQGSLGASGDLAPLAHVSLPLIGEGEVHYKGERMSGAKVMKQLGWTPISLSEKEGLALLNGTQFSTAYAVDAVWQAEQIVRQATICAILSMEAFNVQIAPFHEAIHRVRRQPGQIQIAAQIRDWLSSSDIASRRGKEVQDPYSFRCVPQVHGASLQAILHVKEVVQQEILAVTDNPNIFPSQGLILSGGNFHAQPVALALDYLAIALSELANISERRTYKLLSGARSLPAYLTQEAGLHSGFMIAQYTAASIVSQNKQYCTPASVDSIESSLGQEDHVSMASNAGTKCYKIVDNVWSVLGIEWLCAAQAVDLRKGNMDPRLADLHQKFRKIVPVLTEDRELHSDMIAAREFLKSMV